MKCKVHNDAKYDGLDSLAEDLFKFAHKRFKFTKPVTIVFESNVNNVGKLFAPTGHYDPNNNKVVIFVDHRHPKDILRSLAHELVHHKQNCAGHFDGSTNTDPGYAQRDQHMREMEGDAYRTGNVMLFRDWEDNYKKGRTLMNENKELTDKQKEHFGKKGEIEEQEEEKGLEEGCPDLPAQECPDGSLSTDHPGGVCPGGLEEQEISDKEWYNNQLNEALLKKFKIKK